MNSSLSNRIFIESEYSRVCRLNTDINEHLPLLRTLAGECTSVAEFGTRSGQSTRALIAGLAIRNSPLYRYGKGLLNAEGLEIIPTKLRCYDLSFKALDPKVVSSARSAGVDVELMLGDAADVCASSDMLFIDDKHTYKQVSLELSNNADSVLKYIILHDTVRNATVGDDGGPGIVLAITEFLRDHSEWRKTMECGNNNGLMVLERCTA